jgi:hypothetical protein
MGRQAGLGATNAINFFGSGVYIKATNYYIILLVISCQSATNASFQISLGPQLVMVQQMLIIQILVIMLVFTHQMQIIKFHW